MSSKLADAYLRNIFRAYHTYKEMAERAIEQVQSEDERCAGSGRRRK